MRSFYSILKSPHTMVKNKSLIYRQTVRANLTCAAPMGCSAINSHLKPLQILNEDRYAQIQTMHDKTQIPFIKDYVRTAFYGKTSTRENNLIQNINRVRKTDEHIKHKLKQDFNC